MRDGDTDVGNVRSMGPVVERDDEDAFLREWFLSLAEHITLKNDGSHDGSNLLLDEFVE